MKKLLLILICLFVFTSLKAELESSNPRKNYFANKEIEIGEKIICTTKEAVGFDWENNEYVFSKFKGGSYLFEKIEHRFSVKEIDTFTCRNRLSKLEDAEWKGIYVFNRCYSVQRPNIKRKQVLVCEESGSTQLQQISCNNGEFVFHPEELFLISPNEHSKRAEMFMEKKDSFSIAHGECRVPKY